MATDPAEERIRRVVVEQMGRCAVCHRVYGEADVEVVSRKDAIWMMVVQCPDCFARSFVAALISGPDTPRQTLSIQHLVDATGELQHAGREVMPMETEAIDPSAEPVTVDDILEMHAFLETFDGDFRKLFRE